MKKVRSYLDKAEADFLFANVLIELNKYASFQELSITRRNKLIDYICYSCIDDVYSSWEKRDALKFEITAYRLPENKRGDAFYKDDLKRPPNFIDTLKNKYLERVKIIIEEKLQSSMLNELQE